MVDRYRWVAPVYDVVSGEPVYRAGRERAIDLLQLRPGERVVDLGCGTGLNLPGLRTAVGPSGTVVGVDASQAMLDRARRRADRAGAGNVTLHRADVTRLDAATLRGLTGGPVDAVIACYALSLMPDWRRAWAMIMTLDRPLRVAVVDLARPDVGGPAATALARVACWLGGSDIASHPWQAVESDAADVRAAAAWGGHVQVRVGRL